MALPFKSFTKNKKCKSPDSPILAAGPRSFPRATAPFPQPWGRCWAGLLLQGGHRVTGWQDGGDQWLCGLVALVPGRSPGHRRLGWGAGPVWEAPAASPAGPSSAAPGEGENSTENENTP